MAQVHLVQMPYNSVAMPSLALGLLSAYLKEKDIEAQVVYANLAFADEIGLDVYRLVEDSRASHVLGEWTFAGALFPDHRPDFDAYLEHCYKGLVSGFVRLLNDANPRLDLKALFVTVRERAEAFVDREARAIVESGARIVGCTSMFQQNCASLALLKRIKAADPGIATMMGGPNCQEPMGQAMHRLFPWVDYTVTGEADAFFGDMCRRILESGRPEAAGPLPPGVYGPSHRARRVTLPAAPFVREMDKTAVPDFDDYFLALARTSYAKYVTPALLIETSRGCWWGEKNHCTFCGANGYGMTFRSKSPARVVEEIRHLRARHGNNRFNVADNILDLGYLRTVLPQLAGLGEDNYFFYQVKANLSREHVKLMSDAGVRWLQPGIESLDDRFLEAVKKGTTAAINIHALRLSLEHGIRCLWNVLFGIPGEEDDWYRDLLDFVPLLFHLEPPGGVGPIRFDRFSPYFERSSDFGLHLRPYASYSSVYPFPAEDLSEVAYFFAPDTAADHRDPSRHQARTQAFRLFDEWRAHFWPSGGLPRPVLCAETIGDQTVVEDTRPIAVAREHRLEDLERRVYDVLDRPIPPDAIRAALENAGLGSASVAEVDRAVRSLAERKLIVEVSGRCLALAVRKPVRPFAAPEHSPLGSIALNRVFKDMRPTSLAVACGRSPRGRRPGPRPRLEGALSRRGLRPQLPARPGAGPTLDPGWDRRLLFGAPATRPAASGGTAGLSLRRGLPAAGKTNLRRARG